MSCEHNIVCEKSKIKKHTNSNTPNAQIADDDKNKQIFQLIFTVCERFSNIL